MLTMFLVSVAVFMITEASPGNVAKNVLGAFITPEQEASFLAQMGLDKPAAVRYLYWLFGSDWYASRKVGLPLKRITTPEGFDEWWAVRPDGKLVRWELSGENLIARIRQPDGAVVREPDNERWRSDAHAVSTFWGVGTANHVVLWEKGTDRKVWTFVVGSGWQQSTGGGPRSIFRSRRVSSEGTRGCL